MDVSENAYAKVLFFDIKKNSLLKDKDLYFNAVSINFLDLLIK